MSNNSKAREDDLRGISKIASWRALLEASRAALPPAAFREAMRWAADEKNEPPTIKAKTEALRALPEFQVKGGATRVREIMERVIAAMKQRRHVRTQRRFLRGITTMSSQDRYRIIRRSAIERAVSRHLRNFVRQSPTAIRFVDSLSECHINLHKEEGWVEYSRSYGSRPGIVDAQYRVWAMTRFDRLPHELQGLVTLGAVRAPGLEGEGEQVWAAVWAESCASGVKSVTGYVVRRRDEYAHGKTVAAARSVLSRRINAESERSSAQKWRKALEAELAKGEVSRWDCRVRLADARRAGLCLPGIRSWFARHFPDRDLGDGAMVGELVGIEDQRSYVLAACYVAIVRQRRRALDAMVEESEAKEAA